jgi:hypothetical protein
MTIHGNTVPLPTYRGTLYMGTHSPLYLHDLYGTPPKMDGTLRWMVVNSRGYKPTDQPHKPTSTFITYDDHGYGDDINITVGTIQSLKIQLGKLHLFSQHTEFQLETTKFEATRSLWAHVNPLNH